MKRRRIKASTAFTALTVFIFAVGFCRIMLLVIDQRVIGYANTWDMYRIQDCMGVAPEAVGRVEATPERTLQFYLANVMIEQSYCMPSAELALLFPLSLSLSGLFTDRFDLRLVGITQAILASVLVIAGTYLLARGKRHGMALMAAVIYALVYADPVNTLYFNTFYTEPAAGVFFFLTVLLGCAILESSKPGAAYYAFFSISLVLLGLAKFQYAVFPLLIGLAFSIAVLLKHGSGKLLVISALAGAVCMIVSLYIYSQPNRAAIPMRRANITDTIGGAMLPLAHDPQTALTALELPPECKEMIGKDYYSKGVQRNNPCPALWEQGYTRLPRLLADDPRIVFRLVQQSLRVFAEQGSQGAILAYLGQDKEGGQYLAPSWGYAFAGLSETGWAIFLCLPLLVLTFSLFRLVQDGRIRTVSTFFLCSFVLASSFTLVYFSSIFGDGWHEFIKHNWMAFLLFMAIVLLWTGKGIGRIFFGCCLR